MRLPLAVQSAQNRSLTVSAQRLINVYVSPQAPDAKSRLPAFQTPGLRVFATVPQGPCRGTHVMGTDVFAVYGTRVYRITVDGVTFDLGAIPNGGQVSLDSNGEQLCIVIPETTEGFVVDRSSGSITQITDADFLGATSVCVIDGYYIFSRPNSTEFFLSAINDPLTFNALDFASAEGQADNLVTVLRAGRDLWLLGTATVEVWSNVGATDFPFLRISGGFVSRGCAAQFSATTRLGGPLWLGEDRCVYTAQGIVPQKISTEAIEQAIAGFTRVDDALGQVEEIDGRAFYVLTFPSAARTYVFDLTAQGAPHERESNGLGYWRAIRHVKFAGSTVAGDAVNGTLWLLDPTYSFEGTDQIIRTIVGTCFHSDNKRVFFSRFSAEFEAGAGLNTGQGSDPVVWLRWSDDNAFTFGNDAIAGIGKIGEYRKRVEWRRLGSGRGRVFRLQWSDPVYTTLSAINVTAEVGND